MSNITTNMEYLQYIITENLIIEDCYAIYTICISISIFMSCVLYNYIYFKSMFMFISNVFINVYQVWFKQLSFMVHTIINSSKLLHFQKLLMMVVWINLLLCIFIIEITFRVMVMIVSMRCHYTKLLKIIDYSILFYSTFTVFDSLLDIFDN